MVGPSITKEKPITLPGCQGCATSGGVAPASPGPRPLTLPIVTSGGVPAAVPSPAGAATPGVAAGVVPSGAGDAATPPLPAAAITMPVTTSSRVRIPLSEQASPSNPTNSSQ